MNTIHRYSVPVDDAWHTIQTGGPIVHIAARTINAVEFWAHWGGVRQDRTFRVFGTGQPLPEEDAYTRAVYIGTALTEPNGRLVWHLFELVTLDGQAHPGLNTNPKETP